MIKKSVILYGNQAINLRETGIFLSELESLLHDCLPLHSFMIPPRNQAHARNDIKTLTTSFSWRFINRCCCPFDDTDVPHHSIIQSLDCLTTGLEPFSKRVLFRVRPTASSFNFQYSFLSLRFSGSCLPLLPSLRVTSVFLFFL